MADELKDLLESFKVHLDKVDKHLEKTDGRLEELNDCMDGLGNELDGIGDTSDKDGVRFDELDNLKIDLDDTEAERVEDDVTTLEVKIMQAEEKFKKSMAKSEEHFRRRMAEFQTKFDSKMTKTKSSLLKSKQLIFNATNKSDPQSSSSNSIPESPSVSDTASNQSNSRVEPVAPFIGDGLSTQAVHGVSTQAVNGVSTQSVNGVSNQSVNGVSNQSVNGVSNQSVNGLSTQSVNGVSIQCGNGVSIQCLNRISSGVLPTINNNIFGGSGGLFSSVTNSMPANRVNGALPNRGNGMAVIGSNIFNSNVSINGGSGFFNVSGNSRIMHPIPGGTCNVTCNGSRYGLTFNPAPDGSRIIRCSSNGVLNSTMSWRVGGNVWTKVINIGNGIMNIKMYQNEVLTSETNEPPNVSGEFVFTTRKE